MKKLGLFVLFAVFFVPHARAQTNLEKCQAGACYGFGAPSGQVQNGFIYQDVSQSPPALYCAKNGTWVACGANGVATTITGTITPGTNVSITGTGTTGSPYSISSSGAPPVVAGSSQYSNRLTTAPIGGGLFNSEAFNTANNGVATAQGLGLTNILVPSTTLSSEDFLNGITVNGSHLHDERGGHVADVFYNTDPGFNAARSQYIYCIDNQAPSSPTVQNHGGCKYTQALFSESGMDLSGTPTQYLADNEEVNFFGNGIHQAHSTNILSYTDDDMGGEYTYAHVRMAALAGASEGALLDSKQGFEDGMASGTVTTGGAGATTIQTSLTNGGLANSAYIIFPSEIVASGTITAYTPGSGDLTLGFVTTSDTHTVSSGYGFITASCGTATVANSPLPATCPFTTGTVSGHTGFGSFTTGLVAIADWRYPECSTATVSGGNITLNLTRTHPSGTPIYQGTGTCAKAMQGRGASPVSSSADGFTPNYQVMGAKTTTTWDLVFPIKDAQNGQNGIPLYGPINATITSASQTGTTVTLTLSTAGGMFNHYTAPSAASICVYGNTNAAFNICGITNITTSGGGLTLTYTVGASASITGTGGFINVGTVALPSSNGLGNYEIDCGALVTKIGGVNRARPKGDGSVNLQANNCTMAASEAFIQPNNPAQFFQGTRVAWTASTPNPGFGANYLNELAMGGGAWSGGKYFLLSSGNPISSFQGWGGGQSPRVFLDTNNEVGIGTLFNLQTAPIGIPTSGAVGGTFAHIGNFPAGGSETQHNLFSLDMNSGSVFLRADVTDSSLTFLGQGTTPTFKVLGNAAVNGTLNINSYSMFQSGNFLVASGGANFAAPVQVGASPTSIVGHEVLISAPGTDNPLLIQGGSGEIEIWKDTTPTKALALGLAVPGSAAGNDWNFSAYNGSIWADLMKLVNATGNALIGTTTDNGVDKLQVNGSISSVGGIKAGGRITAGSSIATGTASNTDLAGQVTLVAGAGTQALTGTYISAPIVVCGDTTALALVKCVASTTTITITGTGTDVINYITIGRN